MQNPHIANQRQHYPEVTGVLLAGGKSRRMGQDKALLRLNGLTLFEHSLSLLQQFFTTILIAGDRPDLSWKCTGRSSHRPAGG